MSRTGSSSLVGANKRPRLVSHKSGSPPIGDTPKREHESAAHQTASSLERHSYAPTALGEVVDRAARAALARFTFGFSPAALAECYLDFATRCPTADQDPAPARVFASWAMYEKNRAAMSRQRLMLFLTRRDCHLPCPISLRLPCWLSPT